ncbi:MAG TPA: PmoA family protein [Opitutus sp.]|nr:PmoA family protein [Opitutus sp.]
MIQIQHKTDRFVDLFVEGRLLFRYVYVSEAPEKESPRPYFHPLNSLAGDTLTNFRPNDHPWHHGLSLTLNTVSDVNFWGGPTYVRDQGYQWLANHGAQHHVAWRELEATGSKATMVHALEWRNAGGIYFREVRSISIDVDAKAQAWSLRWHSELSNVSGRSLSLGNPHSNGGLVGSHYSGLQFRGARELLDDHLDPTIKVVAEGDLEGAAAVHGANARWMEWHGQMDTTLHRVIVRFENRAGPLHWFLRRKDPLMAMPVQFDQNLEIAAGDRINFDHQLTFTTV